MEQKKQQPVWLTVGEAAERLGISRQSVYHWVEIGRLHPLKILGRLGFDPDEIEGVRKVMRPDSEAK